MASQVEEKKKTKKKKEEVKLEVEPDTLVEEAWLVSELPVREAGETVRQNVFPYVGRPADGGAIETQLTQQFLERYEEDEKELNEKKSKMGETKKKKKLKELKEAYTAAVQSSKENTNKKVVYTSIAYPLSQPAYMKWILKKEATFLDLISLHAQAYNLIYQLENQTSAEGDPGHIEGMWNRKNSDGMFGIWGHDIGDLVYNGNSTITIRADHVVCAFGVDS